MILNDSWNLPDSRGFAFVTHLRLTTKECRAGILLLPLLAYGHWIIQFRLVTVGLGLSRVALSRIRDVELFLDHSLGFLVAELHQDC